MKIIIIVTPTHVCVPEAVRDLAYSMYVQTCARDSLEMEFRDSSPKSLLSFQGTQKGQESNT